MSKMAVKMGVNTEKSVSNLKAILAQNQELKNMLEEQSAMMVWNFNSKALGCS